MLSPNRFDTRTLFPRPRLSGHPRKASNIALFCFSLVIDPFSTMEREYVLYWTMQTLRIVSTLSHLRALHNALRETFLKVTKNEIQTANVSGTETSSRRPLASNKKRGSGGGLKRKCKFAKLSLQPILHKSLTTK